ncbi:UrcA family protein [Aquisediminimonas profunda]|uniref:UrcA family protein n=1 Tax=Aquisediminimonas profunda TaxID=1550733 RepID=UPI001C633F95|nr:UrcA family protein [Aquisediminimonas profunda]
MKKSILVLAALISTAASVPAFAAPSSTSVRTADLNLTSAEGRAKLTRRISTAAEQVCYVEGDRSLSSFALGKACYDQAVREAHTKAAAMSGNVALASY